ncbi:hypothetical protein [Streptosporangium sp. NPDC049644]|uniref:hypothetical protein n=1 Tax=Streptosporangium sp. NPDC049644 TaxID=3155507 RepID=UPI003420E86E
MSLQGKLAGTVHGRSPQVGRPAGVALATAGDGFAEKRRTSRQGIARGDFAVPVGPGYWERGDAEAEVRQKGGTA